MPELVIVQDAGTVRKPSPVIRPGRNWVRLRTITVRSKRLDDPPRFHVILVASQPAAP